MFLDLKLHDIGNTVAKGVESVAKLGATFLTVHAYPQTMKAAVDARDGSKLRILAVTVLTSYDDADLAAAGYDFTRAASWSPSAPRRRATSASTAWSARRRRRRSCAPIVGAGMVLVTPGIRPAGADAGDQKRIMTPAQAIAAGADYLVVGRPIVEAPDPKAAAEAIVAEIAARRSMIRSEGRRRTTHAQGLLDSASRRQQPAGLPGLPRHGGCRRTSASAPSFWRAAAAAR